MRLLTISRLSLAIYLINSLIGYSLIPPNLIQRNLIQRETPLPSALAQTSPITNRTPNRGSSPTCQVQSLASTETTVNGVSSSNSPAEDTATFSATAIAQPLDTLENAEYSQTRRSEPELRESIRQNPTIADTHFQLGEELSHQGQVNEAIAAYQTAIQLDPNHAAAYYSLGNAFQLIRQYADAESAYRESIRLNPTNPFNHYRLGTLFREQNRFAEAEAALFSAVNFGRALPLFYNDLASVLQIQRKWESAQNIYFSMLSRFPSSRSNTWRSLGDLYACMGRIEAGEAAYRTAEQLESELR